ncbi:hypothetical protein RS130_09810 [Paraglaciecola aquimarina]|uniref:Carboxypeptidase regulatory-like domain-containing protein n=1 Tax=Paraglaciecola aquimarina TaxID=1235557 RepID=A0ABU3SW31_9ALTE|nr:hypothetical protein [Paraglaciecola aquimarina]MDU0354188.1 hypothetical protein [Paraglaciecola aquimarina]
MKMIIWTAVGVLLLSPHTALAGKIYGAIQFNGKAVAKNSSIKITCSGSSFSGAIQDYGRYSINVSKEGPCTLSLQIKGQASAAIQIVSYAAPTRYNFKYTAKKLVRI